MEVLGRRCQARREIVQSLKIELVDQEVPDPGHIEIEVIQSDYDGATGRETAKSILGVSTQFY